jgi:hypothetical protein
MQRGFYNFPPVIRGDTRVLTLILKRKDILTLRRERMETPAGTVLTWTVKRAGSDDLVKAATAGATVGAGAMTWPMTEEETQSLPAASNPYRVRLKLPDGTVTTILSGFIPAED